MEAELLKMISTYLGDDYSEKDEPVLLLMIQKAINDFKNQMNYPNSFTDEKIEQDLEKNKFCLFDLILYDYNMNGVEFQTSHSESGTSQSWSSKSEIYANHSIVPYAEI